MLVAPHERPRAATWHQSDLGPDGMQVLTLGVWTEKKPERGEDAEPLLVHHRPSGSGLLAVFDGVGGAGAGVAGRSGQGHDRTEAWAGSRIARAATEEWFATLCGTTDDIGEDSLREHLAARLGDARAAGGRRKVVGTMRRALPTTVAAINYRTDGASVEWRAMWAGDSRCYVLEPRVGLQQLSRDHTDADDALALLAADPPMTNVASADRGFRLAAAPGSAAAPLLLIVATDGYFGYVRTPAEFEYHLLSTLAAAEDPAGWAVGLAERVQSYTGDDSSLALLAVGFRDVRDLQRHLAARTEQLSREHWEPMQGLPLDDRDALVVARGNSWQRYRSAYERRMPAEAGEAP